MRFEILALIMHYTIGVKKMNHLPRGQIQHKGKSYLSVASAAQLMGTSRTSVKRWFVKGFILGVYIPGGRKRTGHLYILKDSLSNGLRKFQCMVCGKTVKSVRMRDPDKKHFCSKKCCDKWWNFHWPVRANGKRNGRNHIKVRGKRRRKISPRENAWNKRRLNGRNNGRPNHNGRISR